MKVKSESEVAQSCPTSWTAAYQAPPSRQEYWSGVPFEVKKKSESEVVQSCPTLCDPMDCSLPCSSVHGIFQEEYWGGLPFPSPEDLPDPGIEPWPPTL